MRWSEDLALRNSNRTFGSLAKFFHWVTALLFLGSYLSFYLREWITPPCNIHIAPCTPLSFALINIHAAIGVSILAFAVPRLYWRLTNPSPEPEPATKVEHLAAKAGHFALYFFIFAMPISGWLGYGGKVISFGLFQVPSFRGSGLYEPVVEQWLGTTFEVFEKPFDFFHYQIAGAYMLWILIMVHMAAALYHHFYKCDRTLLRMLPGNRDQSVEDHTGEA